MARRALVVGSNVETPEGNRLLGVDHDTAAMAAMLRVRDFEVDVRTGDGATRDGILAGYDRLIRASNQDDAAVIYYTGHGFYARSATDRALEMQCIVPYDLYRFRSDSDWRGITAWELSIKLGELTAATKNVTVILDCCHASQMSRDAAVLGAVPRSLPHPVTNGFDAHLAALREKYPGSRCSVDARGNPDAVRLAACGQTEAAYEVLDADGVYRGAFTAALIATLADVAGAAISWNAIIGAIRRRVMTAFWMQRPELEGPADRRLFSLDQDPRHGIVPIQAVDGGLQISAGRLHGLERGDRYRVSRLGPQAFVRGGDVAIVELADVGATAAHAVVVEWLNGHTALPAHAIAAPLARSRPAPAVAIDAAEPTARAAVVRAVTATEALRAVEPGGAADVLATVAVVGSDLAISDRWGPLAPALPYPQGLADVVRHLTTLADAEALRALAGEHGIAASDVRFELATVQRRRPFRLPGRGGALGLADRICIVLENHSTERLYFHVLNIGVRGTIDLLTDATPSGIPLDPGEQFVVGRTAEGDVEGFGLSWPDGLPRDGVPRLDEYVGVATTMQASLFSLTTRGARGLAASDGYYLERLSYWLHPSPIALAGVAFELDDNESGQALAREPGAWVARPAEAPSGPGELAIRIADLVVDQALVQRLGEAGSATRIDVVVATRARDPRRVYAAWTARLSSDGSWSGDGSVFRGPVEDFVELCVFASRDGSTAPELAELLGERLDEQPLAGIVAALAVDPATARPWIGAVGASSALARFAHRTLFRATGASLGLYRTAFLQRERFGAGHRVVGGADRAFGFSFSLVIET